MKATRWSNVGRVVATSLMSVLLFGNLGALSAAEKDQARTDRGKELFTREWLPGDHRSHAGDGLGPLFNARSCAECHSLGGVGGAGPKHTNVTLISAFLEGRTTGLLQGLIGPDPKPDEQPDRNQLAVLHPALRTENSFTLHRFGSDEEFVKWKRGFLRDRRDIDVDLASPEELGLRSTLSFRRLNLLPVKRTVGNATIQLNFSERNAPRTSAACTSDFTT